MTLVARHNFGNLSSSPAPMTNCTSRWGPEQSQSYLLVQKSCQTFLWFPESKIKLITQVCNKWLCCMPSKNVGQSCTQCNVLCYRQGICWGCFVLMHARLLVSNLHFWQASDFPPLKKDPLDFRSHLGLGISCDRCSRLSFKCVQVNSPLHTYYAPLHLVKCLHAVLRCC